MTDSPMGLSARMDQLLSSAFSENDGDIGAQFLGDWIVIAEVFSEDGPVLRLVVNDKTPLWRQQGLLTFAGDDLVHDMLLFRLREDEGE